MNHGYGIEAHRDGPHGEHRRPVRYLVLIESGGSMVARLFLESRELVAEFDAGTEEVSAMTQGLLPQRDASGPEWDRALEGHSIAERAAAEIYTLDI
jgi:hypothetical protein